jgi:chitin synthase
MQKILDGMSAENATAHLKCLDTAFYVGETDFRKTARCLVQNYLLLAFSIILITTIAAKCELVDSW